jgi:hypothetical protein
MLISLTPPTVTGLILSSAPMVGCSSAPNISARLGPYKSQSHSPVRRPCDWNAAARFAATVDLPTPPLPLATATIRFTPGRSSWGKAPAAPGDGGGALT